MAIAGSGARREDFLRMCMLLDTADRAYQLILARFPWYLQGHGHAQHSFAGSC